MLTTKAFQSINSSAFIDTNQPLTDAQFSRIMEILSKVSLSDPIKSQQYCLFLKKRRIRNNRPKAPYAFIMPPKVEQWSSSNDSALAVLSGNYRSRDTVSDFCVDQVEQLRSSNIPVLWAFRADGDRVASQSASSIDLLKYLILQALRRNPSLRTEKSMALSYARFQSATTEKEWFQVLETVLVGMGHQTHIIIDIGVLDSTLEPTEDFSWCSAFLDFFQDLKERETQAIVKVLFFSCGSNVPHYIARGDTSDFTFPVRVPMHKTHVQRKGLLMRS